MILTLSTSIEENNKSDINTAYLKFSGTSTTILPTIGNSIKVGIYVSSKQIDKEARILSTIEKDGLYHFDGEVGLTEDEGSGDAELTYIGDEVFKVDFTNHEDNENTTEKVDLKVSDKDFPRKKPDAYYYDSLNQILYLQFDGFLGSPYEPIPDDNIYSYIDFNDYYLHVLVGDWDVKEVKVGNRAISLKGIVNPIEIKSLKEKDEQLKKLANEKPYEVDGLCFFLSYVDNKGSSFAFYDAANHKFIENKSILGNLKKNRLAAEMHYTYKDISEKPVDNDLLKDIDTGGIHVDPIDDIYKVIESDTSYRSSIGIDVAKDEDLQLEDYRKDGIGEVLATVIKIELVY